MSSIACAAAVVASAAQAQQLDVTGSVRARMESWDWFAAEANSDYTYVGLLGRVGLSKQSRRYGWQAELAAPALLGLPGNPMGPAPQGQLGLGAAYWVANDSASHAASLFLKQAFLRVGVPDTARGQSVRVGRFEFVDGGENTPAQPILTALKRDRIAHRLIGNFAWSHVQRSYDGLHYTRTDSTVQYTVAAMRPVQGVFNANAWPELDITVAYGSINSRPHAAQQSDWRLFGVYYRDDRNDPSPVKTDNRPLAVRQQDEGGISMGTVGGHYLRLLPLGSSALTMLAWAAAQLGTWGSLDHAAYAVSGELTLHPGAVSGNWLRVGYTRASGDRSPDDDEHGTFFQMLPTPRGYARFPFFNMMNTDDGFAALSLTRGKLSVRTEWHRLNLSERADLWYSGGGAYEADSFGYAGRPSNGEQHLATLIDLSAAWRWSKELSVNAYLGHARGGAVVERIHPNGPNGWLGFIEMEWRR
jgi:hypothetical protein